MASCRKCGGPLDEFGAGGGMLCQNCESAGGGAGAPPVFQQIAERIRRALGKKEEPGIIPSGKPLPEKHWEETVFDLRKRKLVEEGGLSEKEPLSEKKHGERKPSKKSKESFFGLLPKAKEED